MMKTITIVIPTYNEEKNIPLIYSRVRNIFINDLFAYQYRILFIDNDSQDLSQVIIADLAALDNNVQYIFNMRNFGFSRSTFYGLTQSEGDCTVLLFADMQDPPELITEFVRKWEEGKQIVVGIKNRSRENKGMFFLRKLYYKLMKKISDIEHIEQFTGFGLYDKKIISIFREMNDSLPYLRGIVAELDPNCEKVYYEQQTRKYGKSSFNFYRLVDVAMLGLTSYSKVLMRVSIFIGLIVACMSFLLALITVALKVTGLVTYPIGTAAILIGIFFLGGIQLVFLGILGEYISNINIRSMHRPIVVEKERKM